ncbi:hypothetical protein OIU19_18665 [Pseudomonas sp. BT-42-2]|uniref:hypothetical protein n=1 Tax=Pseudomonas sp. BT-42-2 TaxID=2986927 RepID=UPI0021F75577|nr:hypothetical protein [Pseudomonas sp. BT-42-2]MCV9920812.1 hypothetical protein [Pseudomonas sp. BT-42-2]
MLAPIIAVARVDRVIARNGLEIRVPDIAGAQATDRIEVRLLRLIDPASAGDMGNVVTLTVLYAADPRSVTAQWEDLAVPLLFGQSAYTLHVEYVWYRDGTPRGTSPRAVVPLDLRTVGPVPVDRGPVNPSLTPVSVRGRISPTVNEITERDVAGGANADITFTFYQGLAAGHFVRFFYDGVELLAAQVRTLVGTETPGGTAVVTLPNAILLAQGNGQKQIFYEIYPDATATHAGNFQRSPPTTIRVNIAAFVRYVAILNNQLQNQRPGTAVARTGVLNCITRPWDGIRLEIIEPRLAENDRVTIIFQYSAGSLGTALVDQQYCAPHTVTTSEASAGRFFHTVDYNQIMFYNRAQQPTPAVPLPSGSFVSSFIVTQGNGAVIRSEPCLVRYSRVVREGVICS